MLYMSREQAPLYNASNNTMRLHNVTVHADACRPCVCACAPQTELVSWMNAEPNEAAHKRAHLHVVSDEKLDAFSCAQDETYGCSAAKRKSAHQHDMRDNASVLQRLCARPPPAHTRFGAEASTNWALMWKRRRGGGRVWLGMAECMQPARAGRGALRSRLLSLPPSGSTHVQS